LTGSGISAESGLPTFRGVGGLWRTHRVEELASPEGFTRDPRLVWTWYNERRAAHARAEPNAAHFAIAEIERRCERFSLATQNVDSLHLRAGSQNVLELHGNLREARCTGCDARRALNDAFPLDEIDHACGGRFRPDIVWFGEALPSHVWHRAAQAAHEADVILVVGTSGIVYPAASLAIVPSAFVIEVNPEETALTASVDVSLRGPAASIVSALIAA
jgi:NAD-dependent deacetylase